MPTNPESVLPSSPQPAPRLLRSFLLVFLIALLVRVLWSANAHITPISDFYGYDTTAAHWLETGEYRYLGRDLLAYRPPGYIGFLALIYATFGHSWAAAGYVQAVLSALIAGLLVVLGGRTVSPRVGVVAGVLYAFWPISIVYVPCLASDNLAAFLIVAGLTALHAAHEHDGLRRTIWASLSGAAYGALFLTRPAMVFLLPAWVILATYDPARRRWRPGTLAICLAASYIVASPWLIRNYSLGLGVGTFSTQGGNSLWWGNNWQTLDGGTGSPPRFRGDRELSETESNRFFRDKAVEWIRENPRRYLGLCRCRFVRAIGTEYDQWAAKYFWPSARNDEAITARYWSTKDRDQPPELIARAVELETRNRKIHTWFRVIVAPLTVLALLLSLSRLRTFAFVLLPLACFFGGHALTVFAARYRVASDPLLLVPLAALIADIARGTRFLCPVGGRYSKATLAMAAVVGSVWVHVRGLDQSWYQLPLGPQPVRETIEFTPALGNLVSIELESAANIRDISTKSCDIERTGMPDGLRVDLHGTPSEEGYQYGGARFSIAGLAAMRATLAFERIENIDAVFIDGYDADGRRKVRWSWRPTDQVPLPGVASPGEYVFVPGEWAGVFRPVLKDTAVPVVDLRFIVRVKRNTASAYTLQNLAIALPRPPAADCIPLELPALDQLETTGCTATLVQLAPDEAGLRCDVYDESANASQPTSELVFPIPPSDAIRLELAFHDLQNIDAVEIELLAKSGERVSGWLWEFKGHGYPLAVIQSYVLIPGAISGPFSPLGGRISEETAALAIRLRLKPGASAGFTLAGIANCPSDAAPPEAQTTGP